ncbi:MAG: methyltransferase domain-containing protein [Caulobacteraceae bacterium]|nr:methyltransferase domain-containing protein [Caulobacteraceae bacterium]
MRRDVVELRDFYATALGAAARVILARRLTEAWEQAARLDVMGLGYATPFLEAFRPRARRVIATMPAGQGVEVWPLDDRRLSCLADEGTLPYPNALFDRILVIHALEEADDPVAMLREVWRVLAPAGRVIVVTANRRGFWSGAESTPFGHGRPYTRGQLEDLLREAELEPVAWSRALFAPPFAWAARWAEGFETIGARLWAPMSGVILLEAVKQTFAVKPKGRRVRARVFVPGAFTPAPLRRTPKSRTALIRLSDEAWSRTAEELASSPMSSPGDAP